MDIGRGERSEDGCVVDATNSTCMACHGWTLEQRFKVAMVIANRDLQNGFLIEIMLGLRPNILWARWMWAV